MEFSNVEEYIDKYLKQFAPHKDKKAYQATIALLRNHFYKAGYDTIPSTFKQYLESQKIDVTLYNLLLIGVGYPEKLVHNLRTTQKQSIIQSLMDYNNYVSTYKYVKKLCEVFKEDFSIFELYADWRATKVNGVTTRDWVLLPSPIYTTDTAQISTISYDEVYNDTSTYFVSTVYLDSLKSNKSISLPFKTNLIKMDRNVIVEENDLTNIIVAASLFYYKSQYFTLYIEDETFDITIADAYQLWYYIIYSYTNKVTSPNLTTSQMVYYNVSGNSFPYTLDESADNSIKKLKDTYENLEITRSAIKQFNDTYITSAFQNAIQISSYTIAEFRKRIMSAVGTDLVDLVDNTLNASDSKLNTAFSLLGSIEDSIKSLISSSTDSLLQSYSTYLLKAFSPLLVDPELTATYQLLNFFKPFHTQLITSAKYYSSVTSKLDAPSPEDSSQFVVHDWPASPIVISDYYSQSKSVETGFFIFDNTNIVQTDASGASQFSLGDYIYSRDIHVNKFDTSLAQKITNITPISNGKYNIILEFPYTGLNGTFTRAYKIYPDGADEEIDLTSVDGFFSFSSYESSVHTDENGILKFGVGDFIYAPVDSRDYAARIISKNMDSFSFILESSYQGTSGSWSKAKLWRPSP